MGAPIARRLARCGFDVTACDIFPQALEAFDEPGTRREADPVAAAHGAELLGVCVRTDAQLESLLGDGAVFAALGKGGTVILHSTVAPALARRLAEQAGTKGVGFIDVGVSGGGAAAIEGKLSLFVGGEEQAVTKARPFLDAIGAVSWLGPVGRGLEGKLLNNLISFANYGMSAAILDVGDMLQFDREQLKDALNKGSAQSFALNVAPGMIGWRPGHTAQSLEDLHELLKKDHDHAAELLPADDPAVAALLLSSSWLLDRIKRSAAERRAAEAA
jgi:3-hydroxyisobutyrate dehydrogenase-like beta-hydroxyacid dehydrogenase